ncbi:hypothetical protein [Iodobacter ciconiae]|uniref:hypothetical protein n=1 Tax=Iodobacter ciconiae TaxID=2496266 RepID=UPI0013DEADE7|nr:hypothetical protein [Iodobacter ciconiae]
MLLCAKLTDFAGKSRWALRADLVFLLKVMKKNKGGKDRLICRVAAAELALSPIY